MAFQGLCQETSLLSPFGRNYNLDRRSRIAPLELSQFPALVFLILLVRSLSTSPLAFEPYIHPSKSPRPQSLNCPRAFFLYSFPIPSPLRVKPRRSRSR